MSTLDDLHARITAALDRVTTGVEGLAAGQGETVETLQGQLDEERTVTAQLEERLRAIKQKHAEDLSAAQSQMHETRSKVDALDVELQRLRKANDGLREANAALRAANAEGVGDAELINAGLQAEIEALRAARAADIAEASAILSALTPLLADDGETSTKEAADA